MNSRLFSCLVTMILIATVSVVAAAQCTRCGPGLIVSPQGLSFPPQVVGTTSAAMTVPAPTNLFSYAFRRGVDDPVFLNWINHSTDADSNHIERCKGPTCTNFREIAVIPGNAIRYLDPLEYSWHLTFRYRVRAHGPTGFSAFSNIRTQYMP
jgi:hypothetical protein